MEFTKRLHAGIQRGEITSSIRIWMRPRVTPGRRYRLGSGEVEVDSLQLDVPNVNWLAVKLALREAYGLVAPKSLTRPS